MGTIVNDTVTLNQNDRNYEVATTYTLRFRPTNPISSVGAVRVRYPATITVADGAAFAKTCQAQTSVSFTGARYCKLDGSTRSVWFVGIFQDQESWTAQIALFMDFTNPASNFHATVTEEDQAFHVSTYEFDLGDFLFLKNDQGEAVLSEANLAALSAQLLQEPDRYAKGVD